MRSQILIALIAAAITGASSIAMAKGGGGGGGGKGGGHFHGRFDHRFSRNHFLRNQNVLSNWWGWGWGGYNDNGYGNAATVVVFPQAKPQAADVTGSTSGPCHFEADSFNVPSEAGGTRAVQVVACR
jgi:hypothetical protein